MRNDMGKVSIGKSYPAAVCATTAGFPGDAVNKYMDANKVKERNARDF
jgi:hypothetical protein